MYDHGQAVFEFLCPIIASTLITEGVMGLVRIVKGLVLCLAMACTPVPPIVTEPPHNSRQPTQNDLIVQSEQRAMIRPEAIEPHSSDPHHDEDFQGPVEDSEQVSFWGAVADIVGFPFRAVGWLVSAIF
jgi:hypothetical protein